MADYSNVFPSYNDTYVAADQQWNLIFNVLFIQIVDQKKLQKAEAKLKAKQGKRTQDTEPINEIRGRWGEVLLLDLQQLLLV